MRRACLGLLVVAAPAWAGDDVPPDIGVTLLLKVLTYDSAFDGHGSGDFVVLVPNGDEKALEKLAHLKLKGRALVFATVKPTELAAQQQARRAAAVLLFPGAGEPLLAETEKVADDAHVYTLALGEEAVKKHVMLGVVNHEGKPQLVINIARTRAAGIEFPQSILKVARLIR